MNFPVYIRLGSMMLHPHWVFETLGYSAAVYWFRRDRRRVGDAIDKNIRFWVEMAKGLLASGLEQLSAAG
jgi:hypothetical protein